MEAAHPPGRDADAPRGTPVADRPGVEPVRLDWADPSTYAAARAGAIYVVTDVVFTLP